MCYLENFETDCDQTHFPSLRQNVRIHHWIARRPHIRSFALLFSLSCNSLNFHIFVLFSISWTNCVFTYLCMGSFWPWKCAQIQLCVWFGHILRDRLTSDQLQMATAVTDSLSLWNWFSGGFGTLFQLFFEPSRVAFFAMHCYWQSPSVSCVCPQCWDQSRKSLPINNNQLSLHHSTLPLVLRLTGHSNAIYKNWDLKIWAPNFFGAKTWIKIFNIQKSWQCWCWQICKNWSKLEPINVIAKIQKPLKTLTYQK